MGDAADQGILQGVLPRHVVALHGTLLQEPTVSSRGCAFLQAVVALLEAPLAVGEAMELPLGRAPTEAASQAMVGGSQAMANRPQLQGAMGRAPLQASTPRRPSMAGGATRMCRLCCAAMSLLPR